jgi:hypothetical protein
MRRLLSIAFVASLAACSSYHKDNTVVIVAPKLPIYALPIKNTDDTSNIQAFEASTTLPSGPLESVEVDTGVPEQRVFISSLTAEQEVTIDPSLFDAKVNRNASAVGLLAIDTNTQVITGNVTFDGIDADDAVTGVTINASAAGSNGPVILTLEPSKTDSHVFEITKRLVLEDIADIRGGDLSTLLSAGWYFNVHTESNPGGQLRGQIIPNGIEVVRVELETEQQIPIVLEKSAANVGAVGYFTYSKTDASVLPTANVQIHGFEATHVNLHCGGVAGDTGPVQITLNDVSPDNFPGTFFTANHMRIASLPALQDGTYYFKAHSEKNPTGELRGQITTSNSLIKSGHLEYE